MRIVAFDPGGTTGWATWHGITLLPGTNGFNSGQMGPGDHHKQLFDFISFEQGSDELHVVTESFEYRQQQRTTVVLVSKEYIGVMKYWMEERGRRGRDRFYEQTAGKVKPFWSDDKLKKLGLWNVGQNHANDAMRHLLHHMTFDPTLKTTVGLELLQKLK
jgi:hypothetical protein